jgi:hypothetical protein
MEHSSIFTQPMEPLTDELIWKGTDNGLLSLKDAHEFERHHFPSLRWAKAIWCKDIPSSRYLLAWRIMLVIYVLSMQLPR